MRFELEKEVNPAFIAAKVRVNSETPLILPTTSYHYESINQYFVVSDHIRRTLKVLHDISQGLQLKLERMGNSDKLALVTNSGRYYYYYFNNKINYYNLYSTVSYNVTTIDLIPINKKNSSNALVHDYKGHDAILESLENSKVLIDPKDIISSKNINPILKNLKTSSSSRLKIQIGKEFSKVSQGDIYKSAEVRDFTGNKIGILNNVVPYFQQISGSFHLFPFDEEFENSYFAAEKLGDNYVGCISDENGECKNFYPLNPNSFGYKYDHNLALYPYYYNLENFGNFLEVNVVNFKDVIDLEERVRILENKIEGLRYADIKGQKGDTGPQVKMLILQRLQKNLSMIKWRN